MPIFVTMDARIRKVVDHLERHLAKPMNLEALAQLACMSASHFHRSFKRDTGRTPFQWIEEMKMDKAKQLLLQDAPSVQMIADQLGYRDYETFSRAFKKHYGFSPDDYKAIAKKVNADVGLGSRGMVMQKYHIQDHSDYDHALDDIIKQLKQFICDSGFTQEELKGSKVVTVFPKGAFAGDAKSIIKNKYTVAENQEIRRRLLDDNSIADA